ncbi:RNA ligase family protein [Paenibacillus chartarius]|uniref:DNA ligase (ATP) n=1 Tax=Paenibacillus chartarius TaxID=747481 RepID=A0ABV6DKZ4_9BACL
MQPIVPFEPVSGSAIPVGPQWQYQIKWDGTRILAYTENGTTRLFNRKLRERTYNYPEIADTRQYCMAESVILDGEVIALADDGKPSFHEVMRRDGIRRLERVGQVQKAVPVTYMIFDVLYVNGEWVTNRPLAERQRLLADIVIPTPSVQLAASFPDGDALFALMEKNAMEGIVCKDSASTYTIDGKDNRWIKVKNYGDVIAAIGGFTLNGGVVNAVLLGLYDRQGLFRYIGHVGTGKMTKAEWRNLTDVLKPLVTVKSPFAEAHPDMKKDTYWVKPQLAVKVQYSEWRWQEGRTLRQPSIQSFVDVPASECIWQGPPD